MTDAEPKGEEMEKKSNDASVKSVSIVESQEMQKPKRRTSKRLSKRGSSFFQKLSMSFRRSSGERGADVETLRGTHGPDFEDFAMISRGDAGGCGCFGGSENLKERLLLIKGPFCFVFNKEDDPAPKYAISLAHVKAKASQGTTVVTLETNLGDIEYEITFKEEKIAMQFKDAATAQAAVGEAEEVRKRLGHEHLLNKRKSVRYAEKVALKKLEDQPEKPEKLTADDMAYVGNPMVGI